jgi:hypothetical protein
MDTLRIIQEIDAHISRLQQVKAILTGTASKRGLGRPNTKEAASSTAADEPTKRVLSAEARAKIAAAQKARWAKSKRADKKAAKKAAAVKTAPAKKLAKKSEKSAKPVKGTKAENKPVAQS